jgi:SAM-dependent methyltransferase
MTAEENFERLVAGAMTQEFSGWDFSYLNGRWQSSSLPWDYRAIVTPLMAHASSMLDIGTGGGEFLASLAPFPPVTWAWEGYPPNIEVARRRLEPLGVQVAGVANGENPQLPFDNETFDLIIDRHEGYRASEVFRIMRPGGRFVTQQVGGQNCLAINRVLQEVPSAPYTFWTLEYELAQLRDAGFQIEQAREVFPPLAFFDIGALVFYLKVVPWQVEDFSVDRYRDKLLQIHHLIEDQRKFVVSEHRILVEAVRI